MKMTDGRHEMKRLGGDFYKMSGRVSERENFFFPLLA